MMNYYGLDILLRTLLMTLFFVAANFSLVTLLQIAKRKRVLHAKLILPLLTIVNSGLCVLYATETRAVKFSRDLPRVVEIVCEMPILLTVCILLLSLGYVAFVCYGHLKFRRKNLSRASIKESLDKLPTGLCFYRTNGRPILINEVMQTLCYRLVGRDLQNASLFREILTDGEVLPEVERLTFGEHPSFRLPDGKVWTFSCTTLDSGVLQLVAADTTELSEINEALKNGNQELAAVNARLRAYGERVEELTRTKERIEVKAGIHRELGQALLVTRRSLLDDGGALDAPIAIWENIVAVLRHEAELKTDTDPFDDFLDSASASGVKVELSGALPTDPDVEKLFVTAAVECLVNGVRHAEANTLFITLCETERAWSATYENDGALPQGEIVEGTGLSSLRYGARRLGGRMEVLSAPRFSLSIIIPKEKEGKA